MLRKIRIITLVVLIICILFCVYESICHYEMDGKVIAKNQDNSITIKDSKGELWEVNTFIEYGTDVILQFYNNNTFNDRTDDIIEKIEIEM